MYLNLIQVAESFGVSERVVEDWIRREGLPTTPDRNRLLFDRGQVAEWAAQRGLAAQVGFLAADSRGAATGWRLAPLLRAGGVWREVAAGEVNGVYEQVVARVPGVASSIRQLLLQRLRAPGGVTLAPVGGGFALPHPSMRVTLGRESGVVAILLLREPLAGAAPLVDAVPITRLVFFVAPSPRAHLNLLGRLGRVLVQGPVREAVERGAPDAEIFRVREAADEPAAGRSGREGQP
jgi:nitrogen PTS system EIIA component